MSVLILGDGGDERDISKEAATEPHFFYVDDLATEARLVGASWSHEETDV